MSKSTKAPTPRGNAKRGTHPYTGVSRGRASEPRLTRAVAPRPASGKSINNCQRRAARDHDVAAVACSSPDIFQFGVRASGMVGAGRRRRRRRRRRSGGSASHRTFAARAMAARFFTRAYRVRGGRKAWRDGGFPLSRAAQNAQRREAYRTSGGAARKRARYVSLRDARAAALGAAGSASAAATGAARAARAARTARAARRKRSVGLVGGAGAASGGGRGARVARRGAPGQRERSAGAADSAVGAGAREPLLLTALKEGFYAWMRRAERRV